MRNAVLFALLACALGQPLAANTGAGKPITSGRRVLVLYNPDDSGSSDPVTRNNGLLNLLTSSGPFAGIGFNFTVEAVTVSAATFNSGSGAGAWAAGISASSYASRALTASNYCIVFDMRFRSNNAYPPSSPLAAPGDVKGDTLVQADVTAYSAYLASGGGLYIMGDNYMGGGGPDGFISRVEQLYQFFNAVAATGVGPDSTGFGCYSGGGGTSTGRKDGSNPYSLESDYNNLTGLSYGTSFPGVIDRAKIGSAQVWQVDNSDPAGHALALAWQGAALKPAYSAGRLLYHGDESVHQNWANGVAGAAGFLSFLENAVDFLYNDNCCSTPGPTVCGSANDIAESPNHPVVSCFAATAESWTGGDGFTAGWDGAQTATGTGGSLYFSGGAIWTGKSALTLTFPAGTLGGYDQICFSLRNTTAQNATFELWDQSWMGTIASPSSFTVNSGGAWQSFCLALVAGGGNPVTATQVTFRLTGPSNGFASGGAGVGFWLDDLKLHVSCGNYYLRDASCCSVSTPTFTATPTATPTRTPSASPTATRTASPTATPSVTPSATSSVTPSATPSATPTLTPSRSPTHTPTPSPSATPSPTASATPSATVSASPTATPSATPTATASATQTLTATPTASPSQSATASTTATATPSRTPTATPSASPTASPSPTETPSRSATPTPTESPSATATPSASPTRTPSASPSSTATATLSATASPSLSPTDTPTDSPTLTPSPSLTPSWSPSETPSLSPSFSPSPSLTASPTLTPSATPSASLTASPTRTATATLTLSSTATPTASASPSFTVSPTATPSPIPAPVQGWLGVYNAAGERVRRLYSGGLERSPNGLNADAGSLIPGGLLGLSFGARLPDGSSVLTWDGTNDAGQTLDGGIYTVRLESEDPFGQKASYSVAVQVLAAPTGARLSVYNSAGELVSRQVLPAAQARASGFELDKGLLAPEEALQGQFLLPSGAVNGVIWDGRGADGAPVASGIYTLILEQDGGRALQMRSVQVLKGPEPAAPLVLAGPSPLRGRALSVAAGAATGRRVAAELFNLAGERVAFDAALDGSGRVQLDCAALASGVYLVFVQVEDPGQRYPRRVLRVAIVH